MPSGSGLVVAAVAAGGGGAEACMRDYNALAAQLDAPMEVSAAEHAALAAIVPAVDAVKPYMHAAPPGQGYEGGNYSTKALGGGDAAKAFRAVQARSVQAGLDVLLPHDVCSAVAKDVCQPERWPYIARRLPGLIEGAVESYTVFKPASEFSATERHIYLNAVMRSPALGVLSLFANTYRVALAQQVHDDAEILSAKAKCPHLVQAARHMDSEFVKALEFETAERMFATYPVIVTEFAHDLQRDADDLLACTPVRMRWVSNRIRANGSFRSERQDGYNGKPFAVNCPASEFMGSLISGEGYNGKALGPGVPGIAAWLHGERRRRWFRQACRDVIKLANAEMDRRRIRYDERFDECMRLLKRDHDMARAAFRGSARVKVYRPA